MPASEQTDGCEHFFMITVDPAAASPIEGAETLGRGMAGQPPTFDTVAVSDDDTAVILYTSGTTGQPKGAELRHRNMHSNALASDKLFGANADDPDTFLCVLPLFHSFGQTVIMNGGFAYGGTVVMLPRFEADAALKTMAKEKVTFFAGVPTMYWGLLGALDDSGVDVKELAANLRVAAAGGSALPVEVHKEFERRFGVTILEGYGLSETSPVASFSPYGGEVRVGSIGTPIPGVEMKLINPEPGEWADADGEVGEIAIKGPNIMKGYYNRPDATADAIQGRLVPLRGPRPQGRRRLLLHRRPVQGHDHPWRLQRVSARDRGSPAHAPGCQPGRGDRRAAREPRRGDQGRRHPQQGGRADRGRAHRPGARSRWRATSTPASSSSLTSCR
ncbi:AMP-binding protein [Nocardioides sp. B-3]|uniref:AMP-binding protein n=1 Tax=Nocardioides sp. B-3 TaxID=2895565 RepID=UPI003FA59F0B